MGTLVINRGEAAPQYSFQVIFDIYKQIDPEKAQGYVNHEPDITSLL